MAIARYGIALPQNLAPTGVEFTEQELVVTRGCLFTASKDANREIDVHAAGTENQVLSIDSNGDLEWVTPAGGHTQNTDTGTTSNTFTIDSDSAVGKLLLQVAAGSNNTMTLINAALSGDVTLTLPAVTGTLATEAYADGLFAANDAMVYKGTIGSGGTIEIAAFNSLDTYNAGWTYRVKTAGTIKGVVCEIGDLVMAIVDRAGSGNVDADWTVQQVNLDGAVIGPASVTDGFPVLFDGTTGKLIKAAASALGTAAFTASTAYVPAFVTAPATKTSTGTAGQMAEDNNYLYICTATNVWARIPIATNWTA